MKVFLASIVLILLLTWGLLACDEISRKEIYIVHTEYVGGGWGNPAKLILYTKEEVIILPWAEVCNASIPIGSCFLISKRGFMCSYLIIKESK